jgi:hypothetical protein
MVPSAHRQPAHKFLDAPARHIVYCRDRSATTGIN